MAMTSSTREEDGSGRKPAIEKCRKTGSFASMTSANIENRYLSGADRGERLAGRAELLANYALLGRPCAVGQVPPGLCGRTVEGKSGYTMIYPCVIFFEIRFKCVLPLFSKLSKPLA